MQETSEESNKKSNVLTSTSYSETKFLESISNYTKIGTKEKSFFSKFSPNLQLEIEEKSQNPDQTKNTSKITSISSTEKDTLFQVGGKSKNFFYKKIGNSFAFFGDKFGDPVLIIGPQWYFYFITIIFITSFYLIINKLFNFYISDSYKLIGRFIFILFFISYSFTSLINPGYPKNDFDSISGEPRNKFSYCESCEIWTKNEKKVSHCMFCDICVEGYDHHCIWTGKCIGEKNLYSFYIFVFSILFIVVYFTCLLLNVKKLMNKEEEVK